MTSIEWTDDVWNPTVGCRKVSEGCRNCYAMVMAARIANAALALLRAGRTLTLKQEAYLRVVRWERGGMDRADNSDKALPEWNGRVEFVQEVAEEPLRWRKPRRVFVNSMSDIFHEDLAESDIAFIFAVMAVTPQHTYQSLTKRPERMAVLLNKKEFHVRIFQEAKRLHDRIAPGIPGGLIFWPLRNVWLGTSVEDQAAADTRIPHLLETPAAVRFLSCEPLLGPLDLRRWLMPKGFNRRIIQPGSVPPTTMPVHAVDWVIVGGESGRRAPRPMDLAWARSLHEQVAASDAAFFFKQTGTCEATASAKGGSEQDIPEDLRVRDFPVVRA